LKTEIDSRIYGLDVVKRALYRLSGEFAAEIELRDHFIVCTVHLARGSSLANVEEAVALLNRELLDQDLRARIAQETTAYRNVILGLAFSRTGLQSDEKI